MQVTVFDFDFFVFEFLVPYVYLIRYALRFLFCCS